MRYLPIIFPLIFDVNKYSPVQEVLYITAKWNSLKVSGSVLSNNAR